MNVYSVKETEVGNYYRINYTLARQLMLIHETITQRFIGATLEDIDHVVIERSYVFDNSKAPRYSYEEVPSGIYRYFSQNERHPRLSDFINWFFKNKQQPVDYLVHGVIKDRTLKRGNGGEDKTATVSEYNMDDDVGEKVNSFTKRF